SILIVSFDVNNLKSTNDIYGHQEGDTLICMASQTITTAVSGVGEVYRYGGDEVVVISKCCDVQRLEDAIGRLEELSVDVNSSGDLHLPFAIAYGFAFFDSSVDVNISDTLKRADSNMYEKKRSMKVEEAEQE
ncbi:MAG: GGDEF domain-containing protein, partial [Lachnospiraceae bacterium]|nr:GGDEF domain-containing protein [Lachnospiraceae bacterium]